jgi:hypothetical protein
MLLTRAFATLAVVAGCTNPPGDVTIVNQYTGACSMRFAFGDEPQEADFTPLAAGDNRASAEAGIVLVRLRTSNSICNGAQTCQFAESGIEQRATCRVYAAGETFGATIRIIDGVYRCPNTGQDELIPVVDCGPDGVKQ